MIKKYLSVAAGLIASATFMLAAAPAMAGGVNVDLSIGLPGLYQAPVYVQQAPVYVEPRPVYIQQEREHDWRERQLRARQWRQQWQEHHHHEDRHDERRNFDNGEHRGHDD
jgi:hypothetical protein